VAKHRDGSAGQLLLLLLLLTYTEREREREKMVDALFL